MTVVRAVLDADVLIPAPLRDVLLRAAEAELYRVHWSVETLEEVRRNVVALRMASEQRAAYLIDRLQAAFPEAAVHGYQALVKSMLNDPKDRHVVAAAVAVRAEVIVTANLRHFPEHALDLWGIVAHHPDRFLTDLVEAHPMRLAQIVQEQAAPLTRPTLSVEQVLANIGRHAPNFATKLREYMALR